MASELRIWYINSHIEIDSEAKRKNNQRYKIDNQKKKTPEKYMTQEEKKQLYC